MSWVRIHDGAMTHPKIVGLPDKAFRLWVWGLSYSQMHLTDGWLPEAALPLRLKRAHDDLEHAALWEPGEGGFRVHDYLQWNDSRETVEKKRSEARERMTNARQRSSRELLRRVGVGSSGLLESPGKESEETPTRFDRFWASFPRRIGKDAARKAFDKRHVDEGLLAKMLAALAWQRESEDWLKDGGQFIPHPATWLNQGRWEDEPRSKSCRDGAQKLPGTRTICPHSPRCETTKACIAKIIQDGREAKAKAAVSA